MASPLVAPLPPPPNLSFQAFLGGLPTSTPSSCTRLRPWRAGGRERKASYQPRGHRHREWHEGDVVPVANREIRRAQEAGALVVFTQDWHPPSTPHFAKDGGIWPVHCVADTWGAEFLPGLDVPAR